MEGYACASLDWLWRSLPFAAGVPSAQTFRKVFRLIDPEALERGFAARAASPQQRAGEQGGAHVVANDCKTVRGSKTAPDGTGAIHLISASASEAGLVLAERAVDAKSNEILPFQRSWTFSRTTARSSPSTRWGPRPRSPGPSASSAPNMCWR